MAVLMVGRKAAEMVGLTDAKKADRSVVYLAALMEAKSAEQRVESKVGSWVDQ